jgi:hypothetical protein
VGVDVLFVGSPQKFLVEPDTEEFVFGWDRNHWDVVRKDTFHNFA